MKKFFGIITLLMFCLASFAQQRTVSGVVTDEGNEPLPGVNVIVKGTTTGTITDLDGNYSITLSEGQDVLQFSFIGFAAQEIEVGTASTINITLAADVIGLEEVVAVGYGVQKKVNLTGSVATVDGGEMARQPVTLASEALQGIAPGVSVSKSSGAPGSGATIRIRGVTTYANDNDQSYRNNPLVLIDGIEGSLNSVNPNDIENMSVLKDAASAAIYGSRGANGVILITTKRAKKSEFKINYTGWVGIEEFTTLPEFVGAIDYMNAVNTANTNDGNTPDYAEDFIQEWQANMAADPDNYPNTNWQDVVFNGSAIKHSHAVSISGGTEKLRSRASFSFLDQDGMVDNNNYKSYTVRTNNDFDLKSWISIGLDLNGRYSTRNTPSAGLSDIFNQANRIPSIYAAKFTNGKYGPGWNSLQNPLAYVEASGNNNNKWYRFNGKVSATIKPLKGLSGTVIYSPTYTSTDQKKFNRQYELNETPDDPTPQIVPSQNSFEHKHEMTWRNSFNAILTYEKTLGDHDFSAMLGYEALDYHKENVNGKRLDYIFPEYQVLNAGAEEGQTNSGTATEWALVSQFARINYNYQGKYLFEANARRDGSSKFQNDRWQIFPSFSAGWRVSEESFVEDLDWLDNLKVRASWGQLGNQNVPGGNYPFMTQVEQNDQFYIFGQSPIVAPGGAVTALPAPLLTWEYTETTNFAIDMSVLKGLFSLTAEYYIRKTDDIIDRVNVAEIVGLNGPASNLYSMENKGIDLSLGSQKKFGDFGYSVTVNFDDFTNEVTDIGDNPQLFHNDNSNIITRIGEPVWSYYLYDTDGLLQEGETAEVSYRDHNGVAGDIKYIDQLTVDTDGDGIPDAGDGILNADDKVLKGNGQSHYNYSVDLNLSYKMFDLSLFFQGVGKKDILFTGRQAFVFDNSSGNVQTWQLDYWTPDNPGASYPNFHFDNRHNYASSAYWLRSGAYLRLKNVQFGVNVPKKYLERFDIQKLRFFFSGQNLLTFDDMPEGWDPETRGSGNYPIVKTLSFGLDVTF